jgi:hypothetical protein
LEFSFSDACSDRGDYKCLDQPAFAEGGSKIRDFFDRLASFTRKLTESVIGQVLAAACSYLDIDAYLDNWVTVGIFINFDAYATMFIDSQTH